MKQDEVDTRSSKRKTAKGISDSKKSKSKAQRKTKGIKRQRMSAHPS